jgi:hypothetical protein
VLYPTDGRLPAIAAAKLLTAIGDPATIEVTVLHVDEYGNKLVADRVAEEVLGEAWNRDNLTNCPGRWVRLGVKCV